jgi:glycosyltransferase involved in cell wall biosynthesis
MNAAARGKYVAYCEGDDYWTDPLKLQKQVDFLEQNPDYSLIYSQVKRLNQADGQIMDTWGGCAEDFRALLINNCIPTPTVIIRTRISNDYIKTIEPYKYHWKMGDYPVWLYASAVSKVKFINEPLAVYRISQNSASHFDSYLKRLLFRLSGNEIKIVIGKKFGADIQDYQAYHNTLLMQIDVLTSRKSDIRNIRKALLRDSFKYGINLKIRLRCALLALLPGFGTQLFEHR